MRNAMLTLKTTLKTATSGTVGSILKPALFAVLMWTASAAGAVPIPGTPVPITLQTFVVMLAEARTDSLKHGALTAARYLFACVAGCIALDYLLGFIVQSAITGIALPIVAVASMGFVAGDAVKAVIASAVVAGLAKLK